MAPITHRSRIHLLAAKEAPTLVILQRKRAKLFHVVTLDTRSHRATEGSWFRGVIRVLRCDVSFDGKFMVYMATGKPYTTWSGLCRLPWLKTLIHAEGMGVSWGGGHFPSRDELATNGWLQDKILQAEKIPFRLRHGPLRYSMSDDTGLIALRFERDGFRRLGDNFGEEKKLDTPGKYEVACVGDDGWGHRPSRGQPQLEVRYQGYFDSGHRYAFSMEGNPAFFEGVSWATWDLDRNLWVARPGVVEKFTREDVRRGMPSFSLDLDQFEPPPRRETASLH